MNFDELCMLLICIQCFYFSSVQFTEPLMQLSHLGPVWIPLDSGIQLGIQKPSSCNPQAVLDLPIIWHLACILIP